jgi:hypothetical protein
MTTQKETGEIRRMLEAALAGVVDPVLACRTLYRHFELLKSLSTKDYQIIEIVESETEDFPIGPQRHLWDPDALVSFDRQRAQILDKFGGELQNAFKSLLVRIIDEQKQDADNDESKGR